jgi:hypothetical protein
MKPGHYIFCALLLTAVIARAEQGTNDVTNAIPTVSNSSTNQPAPLTSATDTNVDPNSLEAFQIISTRNIFDPRRAAPGSRRRNDEDRPKPVRVDYLNLLGAMSYEKGKIAFFDGNSSEFKKSVKLGDTIAGYKLSDVNSSRVTLTKDDKKIELPVGGQLKREDEGEWQIKSQAESFTSSSNTSSSPSSSSASSSGKSGSSEEPSEALKRLLERRRTEK